MAFISLGIYSKSHFLFLFGSLSLILRHFIEIFLNSKLNADPSNKDKPFNEIALPLFKSLLMGLGMSLSFVIELIILPKFKFDDNTISEERKDKLRLFSKEMLFVLLISLLDMVGFVTAFFAKDTESLNAIKTIRYILQFLVALLLTIYILKKQMFKHHFIFTIIVFVGTALVLMSNIFSTNKIHLNILYVFIDGILYGFVMVSAKWIMHYKFVSPFTIVSIMGVFTIITSFISFIIFQQFQNLKEFFQAVTGIQLFIFCIVYSITSTFYNIFIMMTVKQFGATNRITIDFISLFIIEIIGLISKTSDDKTVIYILLIIGNLIAIFGAVGFNEIVIISCCDMNYNTTLEIEKRAGICDEIKDLKTVRETIKKSDKDDEFSIEI
jgi:hypothetical protein